MDVYPFAQQEARSITYPIYIAGWHADSPDPRNFLFDALELTWNWQDEEYIDLVNQAQEVLDVRERVVAEKILIGSSYVTPLFYELAHWMVKPWIKFYQPPFSITHHFVDFNNVIIEPH